MTNEANDQINQSTNDTNESNDTVGPTMRKRKSFKSEAIRLATTTVDTVESISKAIGSTADVVTDVNTKLISPILGATGEYIIDALEEDPTQTALEFYEDNLDMYINLYGEELGKNKLRTKVEQLQEGK